MLELPSPHLFFQSVSLAFLERTECTPSFKLFAFAAFSDHEILQPIHVVTTSCPSKIYSNVTFSNSPVLPSLKWLPHHMLFSHYSALSIPQHLLRSNTQYCLPIYMFIIDICPPQPIGMWQEAETFVSFTSVFLEFRREFSTLFLEKAKNVNDGCDYVPIKWYSPKKTVG